MKSVHSGAGTHYGNQLLKMFQAHKFLNKTLIFIGFSLVFLGTLLAQKRVEIALASSKWLKVPDIGLCNMPSQE